MSTRSDIIVHRAAGDWARIYCHWDGYPDHNGRLLHDHYTTQTKADQLVALGDISSLGAEIGKKHDFDWRTKLHKTPEHPDFVQLNAMCNVYGRDRGEKGTAATIGDSLSAVWPDSDTGTEYTYVFCDLGDGEGLRWFIGNPDEGQQTLRDLGAVLSGQDEAPKTAIKAFGGNFVIGRHA